MSDEKLCISTIDPEQGGGVLSVVRFLYESAESFGYEPYTVYNALSWDDCLTSLDVLKGSWDVPVSRSSRHQLLGVKIGRVLPELEVFNYVLNRGHWQRACADAAVRVVAGGSCLPGLPLALDDQSFGCWFGTSIVDEREVQTTNVSSLWRLRDLFTRPVLKRYEEYVLRNAEIIAVQSTYTKSKLVSRYDIPTERIDVVPVPVDTTAFEPASNDSTDRSLIFVGRFNDARKDIDLLLRAFSTIRDECPGSTLQLIGADPNERILQLVSVLGIEQSVEFLGHVDDLVSYLQEASVFVLPSKQEGLGIAGIEAMSCGLPVVSTRCGGPEDYVIPDETGLLVPTGDADAMADAVVRLLEDDEYRSELGQNARELVLKAYSEERVRSELQDVITRLETAE